MPGIDDMLAKLNAISGLDYTSARWRERTRFLEAVALVTPHVLDRLQGDPLQAYQRIVERYREQYQGAERAPAPISELHNYGSSMETPEPYDPPRFTIDQLVHSDDPQEVAFVQSLSQWCMRCRLRAEWIAEAGLETIQYFFRLGELPQHLTWVYAPPPRLRRLPEQKPITPPAFLMHRGEDIDSYLKRSSKETKRWFRKQGLDPRPWKRSGKDWHYEALALRLVEKTPYPKIAERFETDWRTVQAGAESAAEMLLFPVEDLEI
jgi:hypothetical protein